MNRRMRWLLLLLAGVLMASIWPHGEENEPEVVEVAKHEAGPSSQGSQDGHALESAKPMVRGPGTMQANLFPLQSWKPPPPEPQPVVTLPPPPPSPPPMPFRYMGRWTEADGMVVFLIQGEAVLLAHKGDTLLGSWRVDEITQKQMVLTYMPLNMQQNLRIVP